MEARAWVSYKSPFELKNHLFKNPKIIAKITSKGGWSDLKVPSLGG